MSADKPLLRHHVPTGVDAGDSAAGVDVHVDALAPAVDGNDNGGRDDGSSDAAAKPRGATDDKAEQRRQAAAKVRDAAIRAAQNPQPHVLHAAAAAAESALARTMAQQEAESDPGGESDAPEEPVVWRHLSTDAKPLDEWATDRSVAKHAHFTPFCRPDEEDDPLPDLRPDRAAHATATLVEGTPAPPSDSVIGDLLLLLTCFIAFPLGLLMSGAPNAAVILLACVYKLFRGRRFRNGLFALVLVISLVGLAAGVIRAANHWGGIDIGL